MSESRSRKPSLFCFGLGYSALALARALQEEGWRITGTCRSEARREELGALGIEAWLFDRERPLADPAAAFAGSTLSAELRAAGCGGRSGDRSLRTGYRCEA